MTTPFQDAPPAEAPKQNNQFFHFDPLPEAGPQVMTLVATNFIPEYEHIDKTTGEKKVYAAIELFWGLLNDRKPYFIKSWPVRYSINERANWAKIVKAMTGALPEAGSRPADFVGKGAMLTIENEDKVGQKGTKYTTSRIAGYSPIPKALLSSVAPINELLPALEKLLAEADKGDDKGDDKDVPF